MHPGKSLMLAVVLTVFVGFNYSFAAMSPAGLAQIQAQIKVHKKNKNYPAVIRLYQYLIKENPTNLPNYVHLAYNQYYAQQPRQAQKTLNFLISTKDMSSAPASAIQAITDLYRLTDQAIHQTSQGADSKANAARKKSSLFYGVSVGSEFNTNAYRLPNSTTTPAVSSLTNMANVNGFLSGRGYKVGKQKLQLNHIGFASMDVESFNNDDPSKLTSSMVYTLQPKFSTPSSSYVHQYPLSASLYMAKGTKMMTVQFSPSIVIKKKHSIGYGVSYTNDLVNTDIEFPVNQSAYYRFRNVLDVWSSPQLALKVRGAISEYYWSGDVSGSLAFKPVSFIKLTPSYSLDYRRYDASEGDTETNFKLKQTLQGILAVQLGKHFELSGRYKYLAQHANSERNQYQQSISSLSLNWSN